MRDPFLERVAFFLVPFPDAIRPCIQQRNDKLRLGVISHLMSSLSLMESGLQVSPAAATADLEILLFLRKESWSKKSIISLRLSLRRARPSSPLSSSLSLGLESDIGAGIERSAAPLPSLLSRMSSVRLSRDLSCWGRLSVASLRSLSNLSRRWLIERRSFLATETTSRGVVTVELVEGDGVTRGGEDVRLEARLAGSGLVEVASVCSSTDCEALVIRSPVSRRAISGDISIARNVARNWETSWLWARESRDRLANIFWALWDPRLPLLRRILGRRCL